MGWYNLRSWTKSNRPCAGQPIRSDDSISPSTTRASSIRALPLLIKAGVPVKVVSERLGHGNPTFTIDTYQHVLPGMQAEAARIFEELIAGRR
jgi:integrase